MRFAQTTRRLIQPHNSEFPRRPSFAARATAATTHLGFHIGARINTWTYDKTSNRNGYHFHRSTFLPHFTLVKNQILTCNAEVVNQFENVLSSLKSQWDSRDNNFVNFFYLLWALQVSKFCSVEGFHFLLVFQKYEFSQTADEIRLKVDKSQNSLGEWTNSVLIFQAPFECFFWSFQFYICFLFTPLALRIIETWTVKVIVITSSQTEFCVNDYLMWQ